MELTIAVSACLCIQRRTLPASTDAVGR